MGFLAVGDIHIKPKNCSEVKKTLDGIVEIANNYKEKIKFIVLLGDIFHNHERITIQELMLFDIFLKEMLLLDKEIFILIGNHDRPKNTCFMTTEHALNSYKEYKNVTVVDKTFPYEDETMKFLFVPYVPVGRFLEAIDEYIDKINDYSCIFAHQEFRHLLLGKIVSRKGDIVPSDYPYIINGHIHNYMTRDNIVCVGSVYQVSFNEDILKTVSFFNYNPDSINKWDEERIECNIVKNIEIHLTKDELICFNFDNLLEGNENNYKLIVDAERNEVTHILQLIKDNPRLKIQLANKKKLKSVTDAPIKRKTYIDYLSQLLKDDDEVNCVFEQIFGMIAVDRRKKGKAVVNIIK